MYRENGTRLRQELTTLLKQQRIQQRLGGPTRHTPVAATTPEERAAIGLLIRTYRQSILTWCLQAAHAADPYVECSIARAVPDPFRRADRDLAPLPVLQRALEQTTKSSKVALPTLDQLTTRHALGLVEHWRQAARAAVLAEHDFDPNWSGRLGQGQLTLSQAQAVVADVASICQALIVLDRRYHRAIPGWRTLPRSQQLGWAALACAFDANLAQPDYAIDHRGWRPATSHLHGAVRPGLLGVLQAENNLLVGLRTSPTALNLRRIVDSQRQISHRLADLTAGIHPTCADRWLEREHTYAELTHQLRDIGGLTGGGGAAAGEGANAIDRLNALPDEVTPGGRLVVGFTTVFRAIDQRLAEVLESAMASNRVYERIRLNRLNTEGALVHRRQTRYLPLTASTRRDLRAIIDSLRDPAGEDTIACPPSPDRAQLHTALARASSSRSSRTNLSI